MSLNHIWRHIWTSKPSELEKQFKFFAPRKTFLKAQVTPRITIAVMTNMFTCLTAVSMGKNDAQGSSSSGKEATRLLLPRVEKGHSHIAIARNKSPEKKGIA